MEKFIMRIPQYPGEHVGRGIVICGGGIKYFTCAWVGINMLRRWGCKLPIQLWHLGPQEMDDKMRALVQPLGVECVDALEVRKKHPARILNGFEVKPYSIIYSPFREVLFLDADNMPVANPEYLFESQQFKLTGAVFWPDYGQLKPPRRVWEFCGIPYREESDFESGQILLDKERSWKPLQLTMWMNEQSDFFYHYIHGDKETFHLAWRKLAQDFAMPPKGIQALPGTMCQHDLEGRRIFQHRNLQKWQLHGANRRIAGFLHEEDCLSYVAELRAALKNEFKFNPGSKSEPETGIAEQLVGTKFRYRRIGYDERAIRFLPEGFVGEGAARCEVFWNLRRTQGELHLEISSHDEVTCRLSRHPDGIWRGRWENYEKMPVELVPMPTKRSGEDSPPKAAPRLLGRNGLNVLQIVSTLGQPCGIANFARSLECECNSSQIKMTSQDNFNAGDHFDLVLLQHEWSIVRTEEAKAFCRRCPVPVVLFGHTADVSCFDEEVAGYIVMDRRIAGQTQKPVLTISHPGFVPKVLEDRRELRIRYALPTNRLVVGTSGFLLPSRSFPWFLEELLREAVANYFFVCLLAPDHKGTTQNDKLTVQRLAAAHPGHLFYEDRFLPREELNLRLQACDLVWCWTEISGEKPYASGVASDMYGSGTRMVLCARPQHDFILPLPNVVRAEPKREVMLSTLLAEIKAGHRDRHDPQRVGWPQVAKQVVNFLDHLRNSRTNYENYRH